MVGIPIVGVVNRHTFQGTTPKGNRQTLWAYMGFMVPATLRVGASYCNNPVGLIWGCDLTGGSFQLLASKWDDPPIP